MLCSSNTHGIATQRPKGGVVYLISRNNTLCQALSALQPTQLVSVEHIPETETVRAVVFDHEFGKNVDLSWVRRAYPTAFISVLDPTACENPHSRISAFDAGANQVAYDVQSVVSTILECVLKETPPRDGQTYSCPYCHLGGLSEDELHRHCPAYHVNWPNEAPVERQCPICHERVANVPMQVHIHDNHGPRVRSMSNAERRDARCTTQLYNFSLVVCRHPNTGKYLLCQEFASQGFWLPGGAVDAGEGLVSAAKRETMEEAGMKVDIKGILAIEYHPCGRTRNDKFLVRMRVVFYAEPTEEYMHRYPKCIPDFESAGACWCSLQDMATLQLRGREPLEWGRHLEKGGDIYPLGVLREREC